MKYQVKLYPGAIEDFNTAISLDPPHAALAYFNRALCYEATGMLKKVPILLEMVLPVCTYTCTQITVGMLVLIASF